MEKFSPKIEIIKLFDNLINRIDIDIDSSIENFNDQQLSEIFTSSKSNKWYLTNIIDDFKVEFFNKIHSSKQNLNRWPKSTKVVDYLKQIRMRTIKVLKKAQEETIEYYKLNSDRFKSEQTKEKNLEELKSELFAEKFYFQVNFKQTEYIFWPFSVFTFVTDFYVSQSNIDSLE